MLIRSLVISSLSLVACAQLPERPAVKQMSQYATSQSFSAPTGQWPTDSWWTAYGDAQLDTLIEEALRDSPSLVVAQARLQRAEASAGVAHSANRPQVSANASATEQKQSYNYLTPGAFTPQGWNDYGRATLDFSWELDFWGKNRAAIAAATSEVEASRADEAQARLVLATSIAAAYAELVREYSALETANAAREVRGKTADLFQHRYSNGLETLGGVRQVQSRRASADADVLAIEEQIGLQRNRIAALLGAGPDRGLAIQRPTLDVARDFTLPAQISADLIGRRPDLAAARLRVEGAAQRVGQARAAFYPNVNLAGLIGMQSLGLNVLTNNGSSFGSVGPAVSLPIFNGGRLRSQLHGSEAEYAEAVANYDRAVVQALQDVADAATSQKALSPQLERIGEAVSDAREAWRVQNNRYEGGLATYLDVLSAEDYLLANLRTQSDLQSRSFILDVALVRALGGGYSNSKL